MSTELIAEVLAQHRTGVHRPDEAREQYVIYCTCGTPEPAGVGLWFGNWSAAFEATERHQAERVVEALAHGAPAVAGEVQR